MNNETVSIELKNGTVVHGTITDVIWCSPLHRPHQYKGGKSLSLSATRYCTGWEMMATQLILFFAFLSIAATAGAELSHSPNYGLPFVRNIGELNQDGETIPGMAHITVAGAVLHDFKEIEMWLETVAPGVRTPVHRHDCEEIFVVLKGGGTLYIAPNPQAKFPGNPKEFAFSTNSTFHVPPDAAHQVWNTRENEDLQYLVVISRPPMNLFIYDDWFTPHSSAKPISPVMWDAKYYKPPVQSNDEL